jgi:hypothetical protein
MVLCLMQWYIYSVTEHEDVGLPAQLNQHLKTWQATAPYDRKSYKPLLQLLLSHGARVDLLYPGGYDMLEAASRGGVRGLLEVLLDVEPFRSMMEGTWSSSSSSSDSSKPASGEGTASSSSGGGGGHPSSTDKEVAATCRTRVLDRCSQPLSWAAQRPYDHPHMLEMGWRPEVHPEDAGKALLHSCKQVIPAASASRTCMKSHQGAGVYHMK